MVIGRFLAVILTLAAGCTPKQEVDMMLHSGRIYTVDSAFSITEALAIDQGVIVATGTSEVLLESYHTANKIDLEQRFVYPGFIDAHCHFVNYSNSLMYADLTATASFDEVITLLIEQQKQRPAEWVLGRGWDHEDWPVKEFPHRMQLDEAFPDVPVFLTRVDGHAAVVNSEALRRAGVNESTQVDGGSFITENGKLSGVLIDNAMDLVSQFIPETTTDELVNMIYAAQQHCLEVGLTSLHEAGLDHDQIKLIDSLQKSEELKLRFYAMLNPKEENYQRYMNHGPYETERLKVSSIKLYADGALSSRGALLLQPFSDDPQNSGLALHSAEFLQKHMELAAQHNFQVNTHCIGDSAARWILSIYGDYLKEKNDKRWRIEHVQVMHPDDFQKFGAYSVIPSVQSLAATTDMHYAEQRLGPERVKSAYAYRELMDQNGWIANGSDFPVEPMNPLFSFYALVMRKDFNDFPDGGWQMENALNREQALKAMTSWAARAAFEEDRIGSLEIGKQADLVVVDQDIMTCPAADIPGVKILSTYIAGEEVYRKEDFTKKMVFKYPYLKKR